jgi:hypothetical protein
MESLFYASLVVLIAGYFAWCLELADRDSEDW